MIEFWALQVVSFIMVLALFCGLVLFVHNIINQGVMFILNMKCVEEAIEKELGKDE